MSNAIIESLRQRLKNAEIIESITNKLAESKCPICGHVGLYSHTSHRNGDCFHPYAKAEIKCEHCKMFDVVEEIEGYEAVHTNSFTIDSTMLEKAYNKVSHYLK